MRQNGASTKELEGVKAGKVWKTSLVLVQEVSSLIDMGKARMNDAWELELIYSVRFVDERVKEIVKGKMSCEYFMSRTLATCDHCIQLLKVPLASFERLPLLDMMSFFVAIGKNIGITYVSRCVMYIL